MTPTFETELRALIEANRTRALWSMPRDYFPTDDAAARRVLEKIAARGDRATWTRAMQMLRELGYLRFGNEVTLWPDFSIAVSHEN